MKLVDCNDLILKQPCEKFNFISPQVNLVDFADDLVKTMYEHGGMGLAANQVGVPLQIFVMAAEQPVLVINPKIITASEELVDLEEGCLSFPNQWIKVKRPLWINARYNLGTGKAQTFRFEGITARVFQHEYDHVVNGRTMWDNVSKLRRDMYLKKMKKVNKHEFI